MAGILFHCGVIFLTIPMVCLSTVSLAATNPKTLPNSLPSAETRYAQVVALLGKAYQGLGRKEEAAYEQMVFQVLNDSLHNPPPGKKALTPQEAEIKIKCQKLLEDNHEEEALSVLKAAGAPPLLSPAQPYLQLGEIYFALNRFDDAKRLLLRALDLDPKFPSINSCLGATYSSLGDLEKAEGAFRSELVMDDSQLVALLGLEIPAETLARSRGIFRKGQDHGSLRTVSGL